MKNGRVIPFTSSRAEFTGNDVIMTTRVVELFKILVIGDVTDDLIESSSSILVDYQPYQVW